MSKLFYAGIRNYPRLNSVINEHCLVFSIDKGKTRSFVGFGSYDDFEPWYMNLKPDMKTLSEVVTSDMRKLVLDIDSPNDGDMMNTLFMYDFKRHVTSRIHSVFYDLEIGVPHVLFYSMCSDNKISYHAVVSNILFSANTCLGLCIMISYGQIWEGCVDKSVYKSTQFLRIEMSTKFGEARWKNRIGNYGSLRQGLLSDYDNTTVSNLVMCPLHKKHEHCLNTFSLLTHIKSQFRIGTIKDSGFIPLYRVKPGMCVQCKRVHDRENAFITYQGTFVCWRYYYANK